MNRLEKTTHIILIVVCVVALGLLLEQRFRQPGQSSTSTEAAQKALIGQKFAGGKTIPKSPKSLVLYVSDHCHFCTASAPFYRRLSDLQRTSSNTFGLRAVGFQPATDISRYLENESVHVQQVQELPVGSNGLTMTPTLLVLNGDGIITQAYIGQLDSSGEKHVISALTSQ